MTRKSSLFPFACWVIRMQYKIVAGKKFPAIYEGKPLTQAADELIKQYRLDRRL